MTPLRLASWFKRRMLPIVAATALVMASAAPAAYYIQKRRELVRAARSHAARVADVLRVEIEHRPTLWRYDAPKLASRLAAEGLDRVPALVVHDAREVAVPVRARGETPAPLWGGPRLLWGRSPVNIDNHIIGNVWVAADAARLYVDTATLGAAFALLAALLGAVLYLLPTRAIGRAERRIHGLMGQLALTLQEAERRRIARDLHDGAGQAITAARLGLLALRGRAGEAAVAPIARLLDEALDEVRRSTAALAPPALAELGLMGALSRHCEAFADATKIAVSCEVESGFPPLQPHVETACYRVVQEALSNTARHAGAKRAWVRLGVAGDHVVLEVGDDGAGFDSNTATTSATADKTTGHGLPNIRERVALLGGTLTVGAAPGGGARVEVKLPLEEVLAS